jgi:hypothetical protein
MTHEASEPCPVCGRPMTFRLPSGKLLCEGSHHEQRMERYAKLAEERGMLGIRECSTLPEVDS